jgi:ubiquinone biosynthesis monooxygenase Coq7
VSLDRLLIPVDRALRTLFAPAGSSRPPPGEDLPEAELSDAQRRETAALMRINHVGEVCAQALYEGQMLVAREPRVRDLLGRAAREETDHLAWTQRRLEELGGRRSILEPLFYAGSFTLGAAAGLIGDRWNLGFLAETERQVEQHLDAHLEQVPEEDARSRAILGQMKADEVGHAVSARREGGTDLPLPVRAAMRLASRVMTSTTRWL